MLVLSRKRLQKIIIGGLDGKPPIELTVVDIRGDKVKIGVDAEEDVPVHREEVYQAILRERIDNPPAVENPAPESPEQLEQQLDELLSYAACSRLLQTPEFLQGMVVRINNLLILREDADRVERSRDGIRIVPAEEPAPSAS